MKPLFIHKLKDIIREEVTKNNSVKIDGLGEFYKAHKTQVQRKYNDGRIEVLPPKDIIEFKPEKKLRNDDQ